MLRGALKTRVARVLGIAIGVSADVADDTALLEELANEAVVDVLSRTRIHVRDALITPDAAATEFDIDDTILRILDLRTRGTDQSTSLMSKQSRIQLVNNGDFAFPGGTRIQFGMALGGASLLVNYVPAPTPMTDDTDDPALEAFGRIPPQFHRALLNYMLWHAADRAGDKETQRGERYRVLYEGRSGMGDPGSDLARIRQFVNEQGGKVLVRRARPVLISESYNNYWVG